MAAVFDDQPRGRFDRGDDPGDSGSVHRVQDGGNRLPDSANRLPDRASEHTDAALARRGSDNFLQESGMNQHQPCKIDSLLRVQDFPVANADQVGALKDSEGRN